MRTPLRPARYALRVSGAPAAAASTETSRKAQRCPFAAPNNRSEIVGGYVDTAGVTSGRTERVARRMTAFLRPDTAHA